MKLGLGLGLTDTSTVIATLGDSVRSNNSSFVWHSEEYALESTGFNMSDISGDFSIVVMLTMSDYSTGTDKTILSAWDNSGNQRGFIFRVTNVGLVEYLGSSDGTGLDIRVVTTSVIPNSWAQIGASIDVSAVNAKAAVTITFDGVAQATTEPTDTGAGNYGVYSGAKDLTLGAFYSSGVLSRFPVGFVNQIAVSNEVNEAAAMLTLFNSGEPLDYSSQFSGVVTSPNLNEAVFSTDYTVPDSVGSNDWTQIGTVAAQRTSNKNDYLNPYGVEFPMVEDTLDNGDNFYQYDDETSAVFNFTGSLTYTLDHSSGVDPDRNSAEILSKGSYDLSQGELWVRMDNYTWNTSIDVVSHGGFSIIDDRTDLTFLMITHRVTAPNLAELGNYRVLKANKGIQAESFPGISKGKDVFIKIDGSTCTFYYNNGGTLVSMWSTTLDMGNHVRIKSHARDYNVYSSPETFEIDRYKIYRATPTDL